jgi:hypothetical protein
LANKQTNKHLTTDALTHTNKTNSLYPSKIDINEWLRNIKPVSPSPIMAPVSAKSEVVVAAAAAAAAAGEICIRVGRRTAEDEDGDIPTQYIVVAKIGPSKGQFKWLSVATWLFNGLRIGTIDAGDFIREDDERFSFSSGLEADPYFFARNVVSAKRIRHHLLELVSEGDVKVMAETYDDDMVHEERDLAFWARMGGGRDGPKILINEGLRALIRQDSKRRFPRPWALPVALTDSLDASFIGVDSNRGKQKWLATFDSIGKGAEIPPINVIATFVNDFHKGNLRLKHFVEVAFDADEDLDSAMDYFMGGDGSEDSDFRGLLNNDFLAKVEWSLELWVLPQMEGCSTLVRWNDVPQLQAKAFCDWRAVWKDKGKCGAPIMSETCD